MAKPNTSAVLDSGHDLATGLVAAYLFNEGAGTDVTDYSGNGHHGTISVDAGHTQYWQEIEPDHDPAFLVNGSAIGSGGTALVTVADDTDFDMSGVDYSIVCGVKEDFHSSEVGWSFVVGKNTGDLASAGFLLGSRQSQRFLGYGLATTQATAASETFGSNPAHNNEDYHVLGMTLDVSDADLHVYVDGSVVAQNLTQGSFSNSTNPLLIGKKSGTARNWWGYIFWVYIWKNRKLTADEMLDLFNDPYAMFASSVTPPSFQEEAERRPSQIVPLAEIDWGARETGLTTKKYSYTNIKSTARGFYEHRIIDQARLRRQISDTTYALQRDELSITLVDHDRTIEQLIMTHFPNLFGSTMRLQVGSPNLTADTWFTMFRGVVDEVDSPEPHKWQLQIHRDDKAITRELKIPRIKEVDWPNIPFESRNLPAKVVYGVWDSNNLGFTAGLILCIHVDTVSHKYVVSLGPLDDIVRVYSDTTLQTITTHYTWGYEEVNGRTWTVITFTSDQGDAVITADVYGIENVGDGTGTAFVNGARQLRHLLTNFCFNEWKTGTWFDTPDEISFPYFEEAATYFANKDIETATLIATQGQTAEEVINEWCRQWRIPAFWTIDGKIAVRVDDLGESDNYPDVFLRQEISPKPEQRNYKLDPTRLEDRLTVSFHFNEAENSFGTTHLYIDDSKDYDRGEEVEMSWGLNQTHNFLSAPAPWEMASRRIRENREFRVTHVLTGGWDHLNAELMDPVSWNHTLAPTIDGLGYGTASWERGFGRIIAQDIDVITGEVHTTIVDRRRFLTMLWFVWKVIEPTDANITTGFSIGPGLDAAGGTFAFTRNSLAWGDTLNSGLIIERAIDNQLFEPEGQLIEESRTNLMTQSSFVNGTTGWTTSGAGTFATDTTDLLFHPDVSAQSVSMTYVAPSSTIEISRATATLGSSAVRTISIDHKDDSDVELRYSIQNDTTTNYLQGDGTWGVTEVKFEPELSGTDTIERHAQTFTTEATDATHTVTIYADKTAGQVNHVYHVQVEDGAWASSRIVTEASTVTRADPEHLHRNDGTLPRRNIPLDHHTGFMRFVPQWNDSDVSGTDFATLFAVVYDNDEGYRIVVEEASGTVYLRLKWVSNSGGTVDTAELSGPTFVAGTEYEVAWRKVGAAGELGLTAQTIDVFLDGTKGGTSDVAGSISESSTSYILFGSNEANDSFANAALAKVFVSPVAFSDDEIAAGGLV